MPRPRLLLADDVGLGKTIEAGLLLAELIARRRAHRILIVSPAGPLISQWQEEMRERFGLRFRVLDSDALKEIRRGSELGANPFDHVALGLISMDFAKQETVLQEIDRSHFDVVVIDEAHHCASLGGAGDLEDSRRRRLAEVLARKADALFLLTATPHDGFDPHFASLIELLDPSLVDGRGALRGDAYRAHVVRRLKRHIVDPTTGTLMFREREVHPVPVRAGTDANVAAFYGGLAELVVPALNRAMRTRNYADVLAFMALLKRSVSTINACKATLTVIADRLHELGERGSEAQETRTQRLRTLRDLRRRLQRYGTLSHEETQDRDALEAEDIAAQLVLIGDDIDDVQRGRRREQGRLSVLERRESQLRSLVKLAAAAEAGDPKVAVLIAQIHAIRGASPRANILIYTEYTASLAVMAAALGGACTRGELTGQILTISGEDPDERRSELTSRFRSEEDVILVSTDASAEGLNLHDRSHHLLHLELPYSPAHERRPFSPSIPAIGRARGAAAVRSRPRSRRRGTSRPARRRGRGCGRCGAAARGAAPGCAAPAPRAARGRYPCPCALRARAPRGRRVCVRSTRPRACASAGGRAVPAGLVRACRRGLAAPLAAGGPGAAAAVGIGYSELPASHRRVAVETTKRGIER